MSCEEGKSDESKSLWSKNGFSSARYLIFEVGISRFEQNLARPKNTLSLEQKCIIARKSLIDNGNKSWQDKGMKQDLSRLLQKDKFVSNLEKMGLKPDEIDQEWHKYEYVFKVSYLEEVFNLLDSETKIRHGLELKNPEDFSQAEKFLDKMSIFMSQHSEEVSDEVKANAIKLSIEKMTVAYQQELNRKKGE